MKSLIFFIILQFAVAGSLQADHCQYHTNLDGIGTFGGTWPFPGGPEARFPTENIDGLWEVRESIDGAYLIVSNQGGTLNNPRLRVDLFDPCSFKLTASGEAVVENNTLYAKMTYEGVDLKVNLKMKAFFESEQKLNSQLVLMVYNENDKDMDKYFPVEKIKIDEVVQKCPINDFE